MLRLKLSCKNNCARICIGNKLLRKNKIPSNRRDIGGGLQSIGLDEEGNDMKSYSLYNDENPNSVDRHYLQKQGLKYSLAKVDDIGYSDITMSLRNYFLGNEHQTHKVYASGGSDKGRKMTAGSNFVDLRLFKATSGGGGNGSVSFFRDAYQPVGPPDGGDGGDGGDVYIQAVQGLTSLHKVKKSYRSKDGKSGRGSQLDGKKGEDVIIEVPVGTTIRWLPDPRDVRAVLKETDYNIDKSCLGLKSLGPSHDLIQFFREGYAPGEGWIFKERDEDYFLERSFFIDLNEQIKEHDKDLILQELSSDVFPLLGIDLEVPSSRPMLLLKGGKGGLGNTHFLNKDIRNPRFAKRGREGISQFFLLELKLIADLGLVGLPNAGKSSLLQAISNARPRVGHWEFTTLQPSLGTIFTTIDKDPFSVADIPGIIQGASQNKGMGLDFLRHIERSGGLVFVVSLDAPDAVADLTTLVNEVGPKRMANKSVLVVATKADVKDSFIVYSPLREFCENKGWKIVPVCALLGENIEKCIKLMSETANK